MPRAIRASNVGFALPFDQGRAVGGTGCAGVERDGEVQVSLSGDLPIG